MTSLLFGRTDTSNSAAINPAASTNATAKTSSLSSSAKNGNATAAAAPVGEQKENTPHYHFIHSMLIPSTMKIQKELRGRRFKEVQSKLGEAAASLYAFQYEQWPPEQVIVHNEVADMEREDPTPDDIQNTDEITKPPARDANKDDNEADDYETTTMDESVVGDFAEAPITTTENNLKAFDDVSTATATTTATHTTTNSSSTPPLTSTVRGNRRDASSTDSNTERQAEDDPQTRIPMHQSVKDALEAYIMVMEHPQKTNQACEDALSCVKQLVVRDYVSGRAGGRDDTSGSGAALRGADSVNTSQHPTTPQENGVDSAPPPSLMHRLIVGVQKCSESNTESVQSKVIDTFKEILTHHQCSIHEVSMLLAIRSIFHIYLVTKSVPVKEAAKAALVDMVSNIAWRMEEIQFKEQVSNSLFHTDSFYLMRSLVKLSSKELKGIDNKAMTPANFLAQQFFTTKAVDPLALYNKVLSLELILTMMECAGDALCNSERFVNVVQVQLCVALLKNCMSNNTQISFLSQRIFLILVYKFKTHLKDEIQVFCQNIFFRILDSDNSSCTQKGLVLESLRSLCQDQYSLAQIFLNYDCDFDSMNLYKDIVFHLTKLSAKTTATLTANMPKKGADEHQDLSLASVEVLVTILGAFLKAMGLQASESETNDIAGERIRARLELENVGRSTTSQLLKMKLTGEAPSPTVATPAKSAAEGKLSAQDIEELQHRDEAVKYSQANTPSLLHSKSSSDVAGRIAEEFDRKRNAESNFELGAVKFAMNLKDGLNFFFENGFVSLDAKEIALFFLANKDKLDKTQMGEVLGREPDASFVKKEGIEPDKGGPGFYVRILHHYTEAQDYTGIPFDDAIRLFLSGFRLPGEAQKIDRIMERFAERFTRQNPEVFPNADTAFILAFSVIMLNTDLHNPSIKPERRMTMDAFLRNNRGIGENGQDLPEDFLRDIFNRIKERPFSLKEDDAAREKAMGAIQDSYFVGEGGLLGFGLVGPPTTAERKKEQFKKEREEMLSATEELLRRRKRKSTVAGGRSVALSVAPADVVSPMFDVTWGPILGILSQVIEMSADERLVAVCFNGFVYSIRIASHGQMSLARETFVNTLMKFTLLGSIKEMKFKNIVAIRTLMKIALADGEHLGESWGPILQCISQLAKMRIAASGLASDESFFEDDSKTGSKATPNKSNLKTEENKETELSNQRAVLETVSEQVIDQIFSSTVKMSAHCLADFMRQLVAVSTAEIAGETTKNITGVGASATNSSHGGEIGPSIFSLQRLVEVADYNIDVRPRLVWTQVWEILGEFFAKAGCHKNSMVSVFAIDSLKQLSSKFLEKPELAEFHFQRIFLRPFLLILQNPATRQDIRELVLDCIAQMVDRKAHNLQSGWKIFFDIVMLSSGDENDKITLRALSILQKMLDEHLDKLTRLSQVNPELVDPKEMSALEKKHRNSNAEDFIGMCRASLAFVKTKDEESPKPLGVSMRALCHMAIYADLVADGRIMPPATGTQTTDPTAFGYTYEGLSESEALEMALWRPILEGLADGIKSSFRNRTGGIGCLVQRGSVLAIRSILLRHGTVFSKNQLLAILTQTVGPAIEESAQMDNSPVVSIASESPAITSLDFLAEPLPLPPPRYDRGLLKFEELARSVECAPSRPLGPAELLLEACFTDMRHGGDGDLTQAYKFAKKDMSSNSDSEQPFPDSWIATTGPLALGCLTDVASEIIITHGAEGASLLWPCVGQIYTRWCNGHKPCEALVRIATREISRFSARLAERLPHMTFDDAEAWADTFLSYLVETLNMTLDLEYEVEKDLLQQKIHAYKQARKRRGSYDSDASSVQDPKLIREMESSGQASSKDPSEPSITQGDDDNDFGAFQGGESAQSPPPSKVDTPISATVSQASPVRPPENDDFSNAWVKLVPVLKIRCIATHFLQQALSPLQDKTFTAFLSQKRITSLLNTLNRSRKLADSAVRDEDLAHAFQEAMLSEWGEDDAAMGEEALVNIARLSQTQGSAMFFLTQTAGATQATIWLLNTLFAHNEAEESETNVEEAKETEHVEDIENETKNSGTLKAAMKPDWDREAFAAPYLMEIIEDVLTKFVESEAREGHRIDPNVRRNATESGVKVAIYCTSFASVVVDLLNAILSFDDKHMKSLGPVFFPLICRLIRVQSEEIRILVQRVLIEKFGPIFAAFSAATMETESDTCS